MEQHGKGHEIPTTKRVLRILERWILRLKMILDLGSEKSSTLGHCNLKILKEYGFIRI